MRIIFTIILFTFFLTGFAQNTRKGKLKGTVNYTETRNIQINIEDQDPSMKEILAKLPKTNEVQKQLSFNGEESIYDAKKKLGNEKKQITEEEGVVFNINFQEDKNIIYYNQSNKKYVQQKSFMGRTFLIDGEQKQKWKIVPENKEILGYQCQKAISADTLKTVAWFAPSLAAFTGPDIYKGLPGLILEVEIPSINLNIVATEISLDVDEILINSPTKGKKVSQSQFDKIMMKRIKEMQQEFGGDGSRVIFKTIESN